MLPREDIEKARPPAGGPDRTTGDRRQAHAADQMEDEKLAYGEGKDEPGPSHEAKPAPNPGRATVTPNPRNPDPTNPDPGPRPGPGNPDPGPTPPANPDDPVPKPPDQPDIHPPTEPNRNPPLYNK